MKQFYLNFLLVITIGLSLASCTTRYKFVTKGLSEQDSSYVINNKGERITASHIEVRPSGLKFDGKTMSLHDLVAIKSKKMYFSVNHGDIYLTDVYGKILLLHTVSYSYTTGSGRLGGMAGYSSANGGMGTPATSTVNVSYYLQRLGTDQVDQLTHGVFMDYVSDNDEALSKAKAHYIWHYTTYVSFGSFIAGGVLLASQLGKDNANYVAPAVLLGGSFILHGILSSISDHKLKRSICIYNGIE